MQMIHILNCKPYASVMHKGGQEDVRRDKEAPTRAVPCALVLCWDKCNSTTLTEVMTIDSIELVGHFQDFNCRMVAL